MKALIESKLKTKIYALLIIVGLFIFLTLIINISVFDEKLDNRVVKLIQATSESPPIEGNAYFALMGISAATDKNIIQTGLQLLERYQQNRNQGNDGLRPDDYQEILGVNQAIDKKWQDSYDSCKSRLEYGCLTKLSEQLQATPIKSARFAMMLQRYERIMQMTTYQNFNNITHGTPMPGYGVLLDLGKLKSAHLYHSATKTEFLAQITQELDFWKMQLADGIMLIDKMVAVAGIWSNLNYLSEFIRANEFSKQQKTIINSLLKPLTPDELDIGEGFISESNTMFLQIKSMNSSLFDLEFMLLQPNATMNLFYQYFTKPLISLSQMNLKEFIQTLHADSFNQRREKVESLISFTPDSLYNYNGKTMVTTNYCLACRDYIARVHDVNNIMNLVKLQILLKETAMTAMEQAVKNSEIINPYTDKAYDFDPTNNWLKFDCIDARSKCRIKL